MADQPSASSSSTAAVHPETPSDTSALFPNLPNDVALQCLARVPRSDHPSLSLVCKPWLSLLKSPLFYSVRRSLLVTDSSLYLILRFPTTPSPFKWFLLRKTQDLKGQDGSIPDVDGIRPIQIHSISSILTSQPIGVSSVSRKTQDLEGQDGSIPDLDGIGSIQVHSISSIPSSQPIGGSRVSRKTQDLEGQDGSIPDLDRIGSIQVHSISSIPSSQPIGASVVALESKIYVIGGSVNDVPTSAVWILDSISNKWELGPQMRVAREFAAAAVVGGRIYVLGGCRVNNRARTVNWAEVFDPETGVWAAVESPEWVKEELMHASAVVGGRIYAMADRGGVVYDAGGGGEWTEVPKRLDMGWRGRAAVVGGVLYCYDYLGKIKGFDVGRNVWEELKGVEKGLPKFMSGATMVDVDGRLFVVWVAKGSVRKESEVWCAEIVVEKDGDGGLRGSVAWSKVVLVVPDGSVIVNCLAVRF